MKVNQRKLFNNRSARNKLSQMGGIMASSPELMQTVQNFNVGGPVNTQQQINQANRAATIPGVNYIQDFVNMANAQSGIANMPTTPQGAFRSPKVEGPTGTQVLMERTGQALQDTFGVPENAPIRDPAGMYRRAVGVTPERTQARVDFASGVRDFINDPLAIFREDPVEAAGTRLDDDDPKIQAMIDNTTGPAMPAETIEDFPLGGRVLTDAEIAALEATPEGQAQAKVEQSKKVAQEEIARTSSDQKSKPAPEPPPISEASITTEEDQVEVGKDIVNYGLDTLKSGLSDQEKNDKILEILQYKEPSESLSVEERYQKNQELRKRIFGDTSKQDRAVDSYNLAIMGFLIASGDSPYALQNIAKGAAAGAQMMKETQEERQKRDRRLKELDLERAIQDDKAAIQFEREERRYRQGLQFQYLSDQIKNDRAVDQLGLRLAADAANTKARIATQLKIATDDRQSLEAREQARNEATMATARINALKDESLGGYVVSRVLAQGIDARDTDDFFDAYTEEFDSALQNPQVMALFSGKKSGPGAFDPERFGQNLLLDKDWVQRTTDAILEQAKAEGRELSQGQLNAELEKQAGIRASTPLISTSTTQQLPTVKTQEDFDKLEPGATFIQDGQTRKKPLQ